MRDWKYHCAVLGVREDASAKDVRRAYRRLALERHPDKHNNSTQAKEDFQQLNESYRFIMSALIEGRRPEPRQATAPPPPPPPQKPQSSPPVVVARSNPARAAQALKPKSYAGIWLHALAACSLLLIISVALELHGNREPASGKDQRDLFPKAWCSISFPGENTQSTSEYWSERVCEEKCKSAAAKKDVSCSWSGNEFHSARAKAPVAPPEPFIDTKSGNCSVNIEKVAGQPEPATFPARSEDACQSVCGAKMNRYPHAGIRCSWNDKLIFTKPVYVSPSQEVVDDSVKETEDFYTQKFADIPNTATCYMSVVMPGNTRTFEFPNELPDQCANRCVAEKIKHPLDRELTCLYNGVAVARHYPNAVSRYLSEHPEEAPYVKAMSPNLVTCSMLGMRNGAIVLSSAVPAGKEDCEMRCRFEFNRAISGTRISCAHGGVPYFDETSK